jgi:cytochrome c oxidase subunit 3
MADSLIQNDIKAPAWKGGDVPYKASYGKMMMWFFLITDTLTFSAFLTGYGFSRFKFKDIWPVPEDVFTHFPFLHGDPPIIICSPYDLYFNHEFCYHGFSSKLWS